MIFLISFNYKKLDFPCFFSKKYAMINVVLINNLFFISNILFFRWAKIVQTESKSKFICFYQGAAYFRLSKGKQYF